MLRTLTLLCLSLGTAQAKAAPSEANIRNFGAIGDGKADDTAAIQKAVDSGLGDIRLPKGDYRITQSIVIDLDKLGFTSIHGNGVATIIMDGPGPALKFLVTHFKSADPQGFEAKVWQQQRMPLVDGLGILGRHPKSVGIEAVGTMQLTITRVHIRQALHGIHLRENNRNVIISDCHIYENRGIGIYYDDVNLHQSNITACHISYNHGGGIVSRGGNVRNIHITGCDIESNMSPEAPATANVLIDCSNSPYGTGEVAITGCTIQHNHLSPGSANIRILSRSNKPRPPANMVREGNVTITGNVLSDVMVNIHLKDCRSVAITGNTLWKGYQHNLLIEGCSNVVVGPNCFDRNPRYGPHDGPVAHNSLIVRNSEDCTLTGLHISNALNAPAALLIENCRRMNITNCTILDYDNVGLLLKNLSHSRVSDCLIRDDRPDAKSTPLKIIGGKDNMIIDNALGLGNSDN